MGSTKIRNGQFWGKWGEMCNLLAKWACFLWKLIPKQSLSCVLCLILHIPIILDRV